MSQQTCIADKSCPMTAGYYIGGGQYICWAHALVTPGVMQAVHKQELVALERQGHDPAE